jgi:hypothetical protein
MTPSPTERELQATTADIEIIYDVCWMLSPMQIQRMCTNYYVADYEVGFVVIFLHSCADQMVDPDLARDPAGGRITSERQRPNGPSSSLPRE